MEKPRLVLDFDAIYSPMGLRPGAVTFVKTLRAVYDIVLISATVSCAKIRERCKDLIPFCIEVVGIGNNLRWVHESSPIVFFGRLAPAGAKWDVLRHGMVPSAPIIANDRHLHFSSFKFKQIAVDLRKGLSAPEAIHSAICVLQGLECSKLSWKPYYASLGIKQALGRTMEKSAETAHMTRCHSQWRVDVLEDQNQSTEATPEEIRDYDRAQKIKRLKPDEIMTNAVAVEIFPLQKIREKKAQEEEKLLEAEAKESDAFHLRLLDGMTID